MLTSVAPRLPMRSLPETKAYYTEKLGFEMIADFGNYLIVKRDLVELHFFAMAELDVYQNYGQAYVRVRDGIEEIYNSFKQAGAQFTGGGVLKTQPWGMIEFAVMDSDHNCISFGQATG